MTLVSNWSARFAKAALRVGLTFLALIAALIVFAHFAYWSLINVIPSPNGAVVASVLRSNSERGTVPYGEHVVLTPRWQTFTRTLAEPVFASHCFGHVKVRWISDAKLEISCETEAGSPMHKLARWEGIDIEYSITVRPATYNRFHGTSRFAGPHLNNGWAS